MFGTGILAACIISANAGIVRTRDDFVTAQEITINTSTAQGTATLRRVPMQENGLSYVFENTEICKGSLEACEKAIRRLEVGYFRAVWDEYVTVEYIDGTKIWYKQPRSTLLRNRSDAWVRGTMQYGGVVLGRILDGLILSGLGVTGLIGFDHPINRLAAKLCLAQYPQDLFITCLRCDHAQTRNIQASAKNRVKELVLESAEKHMQQGMTVVPLQKAAMDAGRALSNEKPRLSLIGPHAQERNPSKGFLAKQRTAVAELSASSKPVSPKAASVLPTVTPLEDDRFPEEEYHGQWPQEILKQVAGVRTENVGPISGQAFALFTNRDRLSGNAKQIVDAWLQTRAGKKLYDEGYRWNGKWSSDMNGEDEAEGLSYAQFEKLSE